MHSGVNATDTIVKIIILWVCFLQSINYVANRFLLDGLFFGKKNTHTNFCSFVGCYIYVAEHHEQQ